MSKAFSFSIKALAILLAVLTVAYLLPMTVFGEMVAESGSVAESSSGAEDGTETALTPEQLIAENYFKPEEEIPADALCEDTGKRESNVKQFLMSDGSYTMAVYAQNVHYMDENGEWQDIDNTLSESGSVYANKNARIKFSKKIPGNEGIFTLHENNRKITVSLEGAIKKTEGTVTNKVTDHGENATELQKMTALDNLSASVLYADILENTDIEYLLNGSDIKENIIIKAKGEEYVYVFTLSLNNLTARLEGNEVLLCDGDEHVYTIPAPFMLDASGKRSDSVTYALADSGNGKYTLTVTADASWINAEERVFPVIVDPAIETMEDTVITFDTASTQTFINNYTGDNYIEHETMDNSLWVGDADNVSYSGYIKIGNINVPSVSSELLDSYVEIKQKNYKYRGWNLDSEDPVYNASPYLEIVARACGEWVPGSLTYRNSPASDYNGASYGNSGNFFTNGQYCKIEITDFIRSAWAAGQNTVYVCLTVDDYNISEYCREFYTETDTGSEPTLIIRYKNKTGMESYWSATSHSVGFVGSGSVNNETGELTFVIDTLSSTDSLLPVGMSLVYSGAYAGQAWNNSNSALPYSQSPAANGFKLGIHETIVPFFIGDTEYLILTDSDGTEHLLVPTTTAGQYTDVDGMGITLNVIDNHDYYYNDKQGNRYGFHRITGTNRACLVEIRDTDGNKLMIDVTSDHLKPEKIRLCPAGYGTAITETIMQLRTTYNSAGVISSVYNPNTREAYIFLYGDSVTDDELSQNKSGYLRKILFVNEKVHPVNDDPNTEGYPTPDFTVYTQTNKYTVLASASYEYDTLGRLISARDDKQNREIRYTYDDSGRVITVAEYAGDSTENTVIGQQLGFTYGIGKSSVRSSGGDDIYGLNAAGETDDLVTHYVFDSEGRTITAYTTDVEGNTLYGASNADYVDGNEKAKNKLESNISSKNTPPQLLVNGNFEKSFSDTNGGWEASDPDAHEKTSRYIFDSGYASLKLSGSVTQSYIQQSVSLSQKSYTLTVYLTSQYCDGFELKAQILFGSAVVAEKNLPLNKEMEKEGKYVDVLSFEPSEAGLYTVKLTLSASGDILSNNEVKIYSVILTESIGASPVSHLDNGDFENGVSSWSVASGAATSITAAYIGSVHGSALELGSSANASSAKYNLFDIHYSKYDYMYGSDDFYTYTIAAWAKKSDAVKRNCNFRLRVEAVFDKVSATDVTYIDVGVYDFNQTTSAWQYGITSFSIDHAGKKLMGINIYLEYDGTDGTVYFDDIVMLNGAGMVTLYAYDKNGNPSVIRENTTNTYYTYTEDNRLAFVVDSEGTMTEYRYDDTNERRLDSELNYTFTGVYKEDGDDRIVRSGEICLESYTVYDYNDYGQRTVTTTYAVDIPIDGIKSELGNIVILHSVGTNDPNVPTEPYNPSDSGEYILTTVTYEDTRSPFIGRVNSETSYLGTTKYFYDETNGRLLATITYDKEMASGKGLTYTYDVLGNVLTVNPVTAVTETGDTDTTVGNIVYNYNDLYQLESITTATNSYRFHYDIYGNSSEIHYEYETDEVDENGKPITATNNIVSYTYNSNNGKLDTLSYGNGAKVRYVYDALDRIKEIQYNIGENGGFTTVYQYGYDECGNLVSVIDTVDENNPKTIINKFDIYGKLLGSETLDGTVSVSKFSVNYDNQNRVRNTVFELNALHNVGGHIQTTQEYSYNIDYGYSNITTLHGNFSAVATPDYDVFGRGKSRDTVIRINGISQLVLSDAYMYTPNANGIIPTLPTSYTSTVATPSNSSSEATYKYTYDENGNITEIRFVNGVIEEDCICGVKGGCVSGCVKNCLCSYSCGCYAERLLYRYTYDNKGQLIREDNLPLNKTYVYVYDNAGNILSQTWYNCTFTTPTDELTNVVLSRDYTYEGDRMMTFKGKEVEYDAIGNPKRFLGKHLTWEKGRQLASILTNTGTYEYTYNADGLRIGKDNGTVATQYILNGSQVMRQIISEGTTIYVADYIYHENGTPMAFAYYQQGSTPVYYFYDLNLQGDIMGIYDENGNKVVSFRYNAWGAFNTDISDSIICTDTFLQASLFRYRSYIYDYETNFYYLQSRYYAPETGRFINADSIDYLGANGDLLGYNLYAYCSNNPVTYADDSGHAVDIVIDVISLGLSIADVVAKPYDPLAWVGLVGDVVDLIPVVTGVGEAIRGVKITSNAYDAIDTVTDMAKVGNKAPIVIGENMKRVRKYAEEIGGQAYRPWRNNPFDYNKAMRRNKRWINDMMSEGREIIDIGPDFARRRGGIAPSDFYNMERSQVKGYSNYRKVFNRYGKYGGLFGEW